MKKLLILYAVLAMACNAQKKESNASGSEKDSTKTLSEETKTGADKDEHGCIGSAGYTWSVLKNDCIRIFEQIKAMPAATDSSNTSAAYLLFNDDKSKAELFLPGEKESLILDRSGKEGSYTWKKDDFEILQQKEYTIQKAGKILYESQ